MTDDIDLKGVVEQLQLENERLRMNAWKAACSLVILEEFREQAANLFKDKHYWLGVSAGFFVGMVILLSLPMIRRTKA